MIQGHHCCIKGAIRHAFQAFSSWEQQWISLITKVHSLLKHTGSAQSIIKIGPSKSAGMNDPQPHWVWFNSKDEWICYFSDTIHHIKRQPFLQCILAYWCLYSISADIHHTYDQLQCICIHSQQTGILDGHFNFSDRSFFPISQIIQTILYSHFFGHGSMVTPLPWYQSPFLFSEMSEGVSKVS